MRYSQMYLALVILLVAVVWSLVSRVFHRVVPIMGDGTRDRSSLIKVLLSVKAGENWKDFVVEAITQSSEKTNLSFQVCVECTSLEEADESLLPTELIPYVNLHFCRALCGEPYPKRVARLSKLFVDGDETLIVLVDHRVRLHPAWDQKVLDAFRNDDPFVLSCPPCQDGIATFPRLEIHDGRTRRRRAAKFQSPETMDIVPIVALCEEFVVCKPEVLTVWKGDGVHTLTTPVVKDDPDLERCHLERDPGQEARRSAKELVGLTKHSPDMENISKYGSSAAARLAVEFEGPSV